MSHSLHVLQTNPPENEPLRLAMLSDRSNFVFKRAIKEKLYINGYEADIKIRYKTKTYRLHKLILSQNSSFFQKLFIDNPPSQKQIDALKEGVSEYDRQANLQEFDVTSQLNISLGLFDRLIAYMYRGSMRCPPPGNELRYLDAIRELGMPALARVLKAYLGTFILPLDACRIMMSAHKNNDFHLYNVCIQLIGTAAEQIFQSDAILSWDLHHLRNVLTNNNLNSDELEIFKGVKRWIEHNSKTKYPDSEQDRKDFESQMWKELEEHIRWPLIPADEIFENIEPLGVISPHLLNEAYCFHALLSSKMSMDDIQQYIGPSMRLHERQGASGWVFDSTQGRCHPNLKVSAQGREVTHTTSSGHSSVLATRGFKTGRQRWWIKISGPSHWVGVGVIKASQAFSTNLTSDYSYWYGCSSASQIYQMTGPIVNWNTGDVLECELKFTGQTATFTIQVQGKTTTNLTATITTGGEELIPIVNLYSNGNKLELLKS